MSSIPTPSPYMGVVTDAIKESKQLKEAQFFVLPAPSTCRACRVGERLRFIPLTICNVDRLGIENWQSPPYLDVAQVAIGNYMIDSWYKMGLCHFATPTLVICNASRESDDVRLGGVVWAKSNSGRPFPSKFWRRQEVGSESCVQRKRSSRRA